MLNNIHLIPVAICIILILLILLVIAAIIVQFKTSMGNVGSIYAIDKNGKVCEYTDNKKSLEAIKEKAENEIKNDNADYSMDGENYKYYFLVRGENLENFSIETLLVRMEEGKAKSNSRIFSVVELFELKESDDSTDGLFGIMIGKYKSIVDWLKNYSL